MMDGRCTCGDIRFHMEGPPLFVHCCHCTWCQRETGSAFALNAMIETARLTVTGKPDWVTLPSASGKGQEVARCPRCRVAVFSHYAGAGRKVAFVRVGTLEAPSACPPDIHIYTSTRLPMVVLDGTVPEMEGYYSRKAHWPAASLARWAALQGT
jgi:hypothetical protein